MDKKIAIIARGGMHENPGGSEEALITLSNYLAESNNVKIFSSKTLAVLNEEIKSDLEIKKIYSKANIFSARMNQFLRYLEFLRFWRDVKEFDPDLIITQQEPLFLGSIISHDSTPHIFLAHSNELVIDKIGFSGSSILSKILNWSFEQLDNLILNFAMDKVDKPIVNSSYLSRKFENRWDRSPDIVYPFVKEEDYKIDSKGDKILHINPSKTKGIEKTLEIAEKTEDEFIIVGNAPNEEFRQKIDQLENIEFLGYQEDMKKVFNQTKIVLAPSKHETFGRMPIEAGVSGIPVISSNCEGLNESNIEDLIVEDKDIESYLRKMEEVKKNYSKYSQKAKRNAKSKTAKKQFAKFEEIVENCS